MRLAWRSLQWPILAGFIIFGASLVPIVRGFVLFLTAPLVIHVRQATETVLDSSQTIAAIPRLAKENGQLKAKIAELEASQSGQNELRHENDLLRKELSLGSAADAKIKIAAQVISRSSSVSLQTISINKGSAEGFIKGMPVMAQGYLIGRVDEVHDHASKIILVTSADSQLPVVLQNSRSVGLLKGGASGLIVDEIPRDVIISPNEEVVTSQLGDFIKSGIPVGKVAVVLTGKSDVFQSARVSSPIDLSRLEVVFGIK